MLGIEATGLINLDPSGTFAPGQRVMTMMGGMGRVVDGGYAQYTCVPAAQVIPFSSSLDWAALGVVPEMLQTAYGSLTVGLDPSQGRSSSSAAAPLRSGWPPPCWRSDKG